MTTQPPPEQVESVQLTGASAEGVSTGTPAKPTPSQRFKRFKKWLKERSRREWAVFLGVLLLLFGSVCVAQFGGPANAGFASAAAVLTVVTLVAVGIERVIEIGWTIVGQIGRLGAWWPVNQMKTRAEELETALNTQLATLQGETDKLLTAAKKVSSDLAPRIKATKDWIEQAQGQIKILQAQAPGDQRIHLIAANAQSALNRTSLTLKDPKLDETLKIADQAIDSLLDFTAAFKENPARRLISLYVGMWLGLFVALLLRLDLFCAASGVGKCEPQGLKLVLPLLGTNLTIPLLPYWPVALTGLLIGLGSSPTHEVIKYIQESKKSQMALNGPGVTTKAEEAKVIESMVTKPPPGTDAEETVVFKEVESLRRTTRTLFLR
jgi:hypothetical protein